MRMIDFDFANWSVADAPGRDLDLMLLMAIWGGWDQLAKTGPRWLSERDAS